MEIWHQKKLMVFLIAYPLIFMLIFGSAFGGEESPITVDVAMVMPTNGNSDMIANAFIGVFEDMDAMEVRVWDNSGESFSAQAKRIIEEQGAALVIFLPESFISIDGAPVELPVYYDEAANQNVQSVGLGITNGIIEEFSKTIFQQNLIAMKDQGLLTENDLDLIEGIMTPIETGFTAVTPSDEDTLRYIDYLVPGLICMSMLWSGVTGASSSLVEDRVRGIRKRMLSTPISRGVLLMGSMMSNVVLLVIQIFILILVAVLVYDLNIIGSYLMVFLIILIGSLAMIGIGILISTFTSTAEEASQAASLINFPMMFLSGIFFPLSAGWMKSISYIFPLTYINNALRDVMVRGYSFMDVSNELLVSIVFTVAVLALGIMMLNRSEGL